MVDFYLSQNKKATILGPCGNKLYWDPARKHSPGPRPALGHGSDAHGPALGRASQPGPGAGPGPGLCLRAGSQYSLFPHGPNIIDFWKYLLECTLFAFPNLSFLLREESLLFFFCELSDRNLKVQIMEAINKSGRKVSRTSKDTQGQA